MNSSISASRVATLVGDFDRTPAYAGLAHALTLLIGEGRIGLDVRLPSERELTSALGVSRTTVTRAYAAMRESGYAESRHGSGTYSRVPGGRERAHDRALFPRGDRDTIDLTCASSAAPPQLSAAYVDAVADLPEHLCGHGYFPAGMPSLQEAIAESYEARGLPTDPAQILVTPGALAACAIVAHALLGPGDRALVESPTYPNATEAFRRSGARLIAASLDTDGWDIASVGATLRQTSPRIAYLIPDYQNPTGLVMSSAEREQYAAYLRTTRTTAIVDEAHQALSLDGGEMPPPFAAFADDVVTLGSASKSFWGGLRLGWIRSPRKLVSRLLSARLALDLGASVLEQLVLTRVLRDPEPLLDAHRDRLREQRDALIDAVGERLPDWRFRRPSGGMVLWCELPEATATAVAAEVERRGVLVAPGPVFSPDGGLGRFLRIPWVRPVEELRTAVDRLADAVAEVAGQSASRRPAERVIVA